MSELKRVAVRAARKEFRGLTHVPSGETLDEHGHGIWPADQFTFRLRDEGAIRVGDDAEDAPTEPGIPEPAPRRTNRALVADAPKEA